jgi:hypothetical protein
MNHCLKITINWWMKKFVYGNFNYNFSPIRRRKRNWVLYTPKGNVKIVEWTARAPTAHVVVRSS